MTMARQMKAAVFQKFGTADQIQISNIDIPELKEGEVLVKIKAASVNPVDSAVREGWLQSNIPIVFPAIPGWDVAGIVEERAYSARRFETGDQVYAYARRPVVQFGTFAEYVVIPESYLSLKPKTLSFEQSAAIPLVGLTAFQSLIVAGRLQADQTVLILGASGGIGTMSIQIAKTKGATVIGVASKKNHTYMKELGADFTIDYHSNDFAGEIFMAAPKGVDLIFDAASGDTLRKSLGTLAPKGRLVSILNQGKDLPENIEFHYVFVEPNSKQLAALAELADEGRLKVPVIQKFTLDQTAEAMKAVESHHTQGKIVIVPE
jgi:NADPH:quinone reductase-like Zn-dependent oxidoreductase